VSAQQTTLYDYEPSVDDLTDAEYRVWMAVEDQDWGVREYARETERSPGTVGNLLRRAREKVEDGRGAS